MTPAARWALRAATTSEHERLDAALGRFDLADAGQYRAFLLIHREPLRDLEAAVTQSGAAWTGWRVRTPELEADLADLGAAPASVAALRTALCAPEAWGVQYVLEGARLGGRMLARRLAPDAPRRYLGDPTPATHWPQLQQELEVALADADALKQAEVAARAAFSRFMREVEQAPALR